MPWTEEEFFALGETSQRIELFDGTLYVSPAPSLRHQTISTELAIALTPAVEAAGYELLEAVNVRLRRGIPIPDMVVARDFDPDGTTVEAGQILLVCEIMSPSDAVTDQVTMRFPEPIDATVDPAHLVSARS